MKMTYAEQIFKMTGVKLSAPHLRNKFYHRRNITRLAKKIQEVAKGWCDDILMFQVANEEVERLKAENERLILKYEDESKRAWENFHRSEIDRKALQSLKSTIADSAEVKLKELAVKVADDSILISNIIVRQFKVKDENSTSDDCQVIDEQRAFFDNLYNMLSLIIDIDPELLTGEFKACKDSEGVKDDK